MQTDEVFGDKMEKEKERSYLIRGKGTDKVVPSLLSPNSEPHCLLFLLVHLLSYS